MTKPTINCHTRIYLKDQPFLGIGRVVLLENIGRLGSISKAAAAMNMSYRKAWLLVDNMNEMARSPLVIKQSGGKKGGGAQLTSEGQEAIETFHQIQDEIRDFASAKNQELKLSCL